MSSSTERAHSAHLHIDLPALKQRETAALITVRCPCQEMNGPDAGAQCVLRYLTVTWAQCDLMLDVSLGNRDQTWAVAGLLPGRVSRTP